MSVFQMYQNPFFHQHQHQHQPQLQQEEPQIQHPHRKIGVKGPRMPGTGAGTGTAKKKRQKKSAQPDGVPKPKKITQRERQLQKKEERLMTYTVKPGCDEKCRMKCSENFTSYDRHEINKKYWELSWEARKLYIKHNVSVAIPKRKLTSEPKRGPRSCFMLEKPYGTKIAVCKTFFITTLGFNKNNDSVLYGALKHNGPDKRGQHNKRKPFDRTMLKQHVESFYPRPPYYRCKHAPLRRFLPAELSAKTMYKDYCTKYPAHKVSYEFYRKQIKLMNIAFVTKRGNEKCKACEQPESECQKTSGHNVDNFMMDIMSLGPNQPENPVDPGGASNDRSCAMSSSMDHYSSNNPVRDYSQNAAPEANNFITQKDNYPTKSQMGHNVKKEIEYQQAEATNQPTYTTLENQKMESTASLMFGISNTANDYNNTTQYEQPVNADPDPTDSSSDESEPPPPAYISEKRLRKRHAKRLAHTVKAGCKVDKCYRKCNMQFTLEERHEINVKYWNLSYMKRKIFIRKSVAIAIPKRKKTGADTKRAPRSSFTLEKSDGTKVQVCKTFFITTLGFNKCNDSVLYNALKSLGPDRRGSHVKTPPFDRSWLKQHVETVLPQEVYFRCEHAPLRKFLASDANINQMYKDYCSKFPNQKVSYELYRRHIRDLDISLTEPGNEESEHCEQCELRAKMIGHNVENFMLDMMKENNSDPLEDTKQGLAKSLRSRQQDSDDSGNDRTYTACDESDSDGTDTNTKTYRKKVAKQNARQKGVKKEKSQRRVRTGPAERNYYLQQEQKRSADPSAPDANKEPKKKKFKTKEEKRMSYNVKPGCDQKCRMKCRMNFNLDDRIEINKKYWNLSYEERKLFIRGNVEIAIPKKRVAEVQKRSPRSSFKLTKRNGKRVLVCKTFFITTLGFNKGNDSVLYSSLKRIGPDRRGLHVKTKPMDRSLLTHHVESFHPHGPHYCCEHNPLRLYLPSDLSVKAMYKDYCLKYPTQKVSYELYRKHVKSMNISFAKPGKKECKTCEKQKKLASQAAEASSSSTNWAPPKQPTQMRPVAEAVIPQQVPPPPPPALNLLGGPMGAGLSVPARPHHVFSSWGAETAKSLIGRKRHF